MSSSIAEMHAAKRHLGLAQLHDITFSEASPQLTKR